LVPPAVAYYLLGDAGAILILIMLFMAIVSTGAAESIAVSSLVAYDIYREYINPDATGPQILYISRACIVIFGLFMGAFSILLAELGLNLGWVYLFMGIWIGSAVCPLWNLMTWKKASGTGAILAAWSGLILAVVSWCLAAKIQSGNVTVDTLGTNEVMLSGNLVAILSSGFIHYVYSKYVENKDYDFDEMEKNIRLVEEDLSGLSEAERDPVLLDATEKWIMRRGYVLTLILVVIWPLASVPAGVFTRSYFAFWVLISIAWAFGAAITITSLPISESQEEIFAVCVGILKAIKGNPTHETPMTAETKVLAEDDSVPKKEVEASVVEDLEELQA
jgi:urea-proton symporter